MLGYICVPVEEKEGKWIVWERFSVLDEHFKMKVLDCLVCFSDTRDTPPAEWVICVLLL